jgi:uncharacterized protein (UPF0147 family)
MEEKQDCDPYDYALAAALVILEQIDEQPDLPKHERLAMAVFAVLHGMERYEQERVRPADYISVN